MSKDTGERFFENLFYDIPTYPFSGTQDGRIVGELTSGRKEEEKRHAELVQIQRNLAQELRRHHSGRDFVPREELSRDLVAGLLANATQRVGAISGQVDDLLSEARFLSEITSDGFRDVSGKLTDVRDEVAGVGREVRDLKSVTESGFRDVSGKLTDVRSEVAGVRAGVHDLRETTSRVGREAQGPRPASSELYHLMGSSRQLIEIIGAHQKGLLNTRGQRELENVLDAKCANKKAREHLERTIRNNIPSEGLRREALKLLGIVERPSLLLRQEARGEHARQVSLMGRICSEFPNGDLEYFVGVARTLLSIEEKAQKQAISEDVLVALSNNHFLVEPIAHEVKKFSRDARMDGSAVDRNFQLRELLEQGDRMAIEATRARQQREGIRGELRNQTRLAGMAVEGQLLDTLYAGQQREQLRVGLNAIVQAVIDNGDHLVDLNRLAGSLTRTVDAGFQGMTSVIYEGFEMQQEALQVIAVEIAISRAAILAQLDAIDGTIQRVGREIQVEVQKANAHLEKLVRLTEGSLENLARQRFRQGLRFLESAELQEDYKEALRVFEDGIREDPTFFWNQYGAGMASEALGDEDKALTTYRNAARFSESDEISALAWTKYSTVKVKKGELPDAIEHLRKAIEKDGNNLEARFMLVKTLALAGIREEAVGTALELVTSDPSWLYKMKLDPAFNGIFHAIIKVCWINRAKIGLNEGLVGFLLEQFIQIGDEQSASEALENFLEYNPRVILRGEWIERLNPGSVKTKLTKRIKEIIQQKPQHYGCEEWYVFVFLALQIGLETLWIKSAFEEGNKNDPDFHKKDFAKVKAKLERVSPSETKKLGQAIGFSF